jgi:hypothetical protein
MSDVTHLVEVPGGNHFAILTERTITSGEIAELTQQGAKFKALKAKTVDVKIHVQVD